MGTLNPAFSTLSITAESLTCTKSGSATIQSTGPFTYLPGAGQNNTDAPVGNATCTYHLTDGTNTVDGTLSFNVTNMVWYVKNDATAGGTGVSSGPFDTLVEAETASSANEIIYVLTGSGATGQNAGITLKSGQKLWGQGVALVVDTVTLINAGTKPTVGNTGGNGVTVNASAASLTNVEIKGLSLSGSTNAIDVTSGGANNASVTISDNTITSAGSEGIDVNAGSTGTTTVDVQTNTITSTGNAFDARTSVAGTLNITFSSNTNLTSSARGVMIDGSFAGSVATITGFANNTVSGDTVDRGININTATFDTTPGGSFNQVSGGTTTIGASGNGVGAEGLVLTTVQGNLLFTDLDIVSTGHGITATGTGSGFTLGVGANVGTIEATGGAALSLTSVAADLQLLSLTSTNSSANGISLSTVTGTVSAGSGSTITNATNADVNLSGSSVAFTYNGTITDDTGLLVTIANSGSGNKFFTGAITDGDDGDGNGISLTTNGTATIRFSGGLVLSTGSNAAFTATGGGTVEVCAVNPCSGGSAVVNKLTSTSGTPLTVTSTNIGSNGLTFQSISANGAANGILLNTTGTSGGLKVTGTGTANSGGTIQNTTGTGISLNSAVNISLTRMLIANTGSFGVSGSNLSDPNTGDAVPTFELRNSTLTSPGDADGEAALNFGYSGSPAGNTGRLVFADTVITDFEDFGLVVTTNTGSLTVDVTGTLSGTSPNFDSTMKFDDNDDTTGESAIFVEAFGSATTTVNINGIYTNNVEGSGLLSSARSSNATDINVLNSAFNHAGGPDNFPNPAYVVLGSSDQSTLTFDVQGNQMLDAREGVVVAGDGNVEGRIGGDVVSQGNTISGVAFDGLRIDMDGNFGTTINSANFTWTILIKNNIVTGEATNTDQGIQILNRDHIGTLNLTVANNSFSTFSGEGIRYFAGERATPTPLGDTNGVIAITNNTLTNTGFGGVDDIVLRTTDQATACFNVTGNNTPDATFTIDFQEADTSSITITQASLAALGTANDNATVTASIGTPGVNTPCNPALPDNP